jgi:hypothetical protein
MTRWTVTIALLLLVLFGGRASARDHAACAPHIRSGVPELLDALTDGLRQSPTLHNLVERLDASNVVVYLVFDRSPAPLSAGHISLMAAVGGWRYLRLSVDVRYTGQQRIAILGHEVRHAVEIADAPSAIDQASVESLYRRIGFRNSGDRSFDSLAAIAAGHQVLRELLDWRARPLLSGGR